MTEAFKRLNAKVEALLQENAKLMGGTIIERQRTHSTDSYSDLNRKLSISTTKWMAGVHSPTNAKDPLYRIIKITSPVQAVAVKTYQIRLWLSFCQKMKMKVVLHQDEGCPDHLLRQRQLQRSFIKRKRMTT
ncbi:hypothetical protein H5410_043577 [Solanum commersonii]|uniref:Uncharacterized protein n=1 Tax=Solanum commersonii TaxID=4109 RepID=A0A9J5XZL8_SOLCO|nr:hypothetical protein H5410_043577 [Solanum commersonii]